MTDSSENNHAGKLRDKLGDVADKWRNLSGRGKALVAGGTAAVTLSGVAGGLLMSDHEEPLSPEAIQSGQLAYDAGEEPLRDSSGKAALLNYFDADAAQEDKVLRVSIATQLPESFRNGHEQGDYLDTVVNEARSHSHRTEVYYVSVCSSDSNGGTDCSMEPRLRTVTDYHRYRYDLNIEGDFVPANGTQEQEVRDYFREFEQLTGIKVEVTRDDPEAHITVANYRNQPDYYRGTLDYVRPGSIATYPDGAQVKDGKTLQRNIVIMNDRNGSADKGMIAEIGRPLGFADGKVNIMTLRAELERLGLPVSQLAVGDDVYELDGDRKATQLMPDNIIIDNGGSNTLVGSAENDTLVSEEGLCGRLDTPRNKFTNIFGNGKQYCIAEGEFEVVQAGAGDDLIIAARGGGQTIEPGAGEDRIAFFRPDFGDVTILSAPQESGSNTLYLHDAHIFSHQLEVRGEGEDITLDFRASSDRPTGSITLPQQLNGGGVDRVVVVDSKGKEVFSGDVSSLSSAEQWQEELVKPMEKAVDGKMRIEAQEEVARWRTNVTRRRNEVDVEGPFI